ncbi:hypothetical protein N7444_003736 [Penicillium canescens]|nr:hypothetical protein N7444_003736 [Penicillium canescens]
MGYRNSIAYVQRQIDLILKAFAEYTLERYGIRLGPAKAFVSFPKVALLGHYVDVFGLSTPKEKLYTIAELKFLSTLQ